MTPTASYVRAAFLLAISTAAALASTAPSIQPIALAVVVIASGLLAWSVVTLARNASAQQIGSDQLRRRTVDLEDQVQARVADARGSSERLRTIIDSAVDGIIVIDEAGKIESFNPAAERLFRYPTTEVIGRNVSMLMPSPYREEHDGYLSRYLATGEARIIGIGREVTGRRRDGSTFPLRLSVGEMTIDGRRKFTGMVHDLSDRVALEERLREAATLAKIGEMAAVIAHEVKNPLAGIRGAIQVIGGRLPADSRDAAVINDIVTRIDALDSLMKDLLVFARPPQPRRALVDVLPLVTMTADLMSRDPSLKDVRVHVDGSAPPVLADPEMLKIVFQNLLVNSAHAMQGQGRIQVAVTTIDSACQISFTDAGPGIPEDIRDKIFNAFFTTKSRGSGLGLATAKRLIEAHSGDILVECPAAGGTTVVLRLPLQPAE
jgi:two-component system sensor kinase FixL